MPRRQREKELPQAKEASPDRFQPFVRCRSLLVGPFVAALVGLASIGSPSNSSAFEPFPSSGVVGLGGSEFGSSEALQEARHRVLVRFEAGTPVRQRAAARRAVDATFLTSFSLVPRLQVVELPANSSRSEAIAELEARPAVAYAEPDLVRRVESTYPNDTLYASPNQYQWGLHNTGQSVTDGSASFTGRPDADIDAPEAWDLSRGSPNVTVAVIDTGMQLNHPDLVSNLWQNPYEYPGNGVDDDYNGLVDDVHGWDFVNWDNNPSDDDGHGTHVAGTIGARGNNGLGVVGAAWDVKLMPLKACDSSGCPASAWIAALDYAVLEGIKISNNSYGGLVPALAAEEEAIAAARDRDHLFVASAGNSSTNTDVSSHYPSGYNLDNIVSVAATTPNDGLSSFSNYGRTSVDLGAPGSQIISTGTSGSYQWLSGTSMASPHVAGVAALVKSRRPAWSYLQIRQSLLSSVRPLPALDAKTVSGGMLNALSALDFGPERPLIDSGPVGEVSSSTATFSFTGETVGAGTTFECRIDYASWTSCSSPTSYVNLSEGSHTFQARQTDSANRTSPQESRSWVVDTVAPESPMITSGPSGTTSSTSASFAFSGEEFASSQCKLDSGAWKSCVSPKTYLSLRSGSHTFSVRQIDVARNMSMEAVRSWVIDNSQPTSPINNEIPEIAGSAQLGEILTSNPGSWGGSPEPAYSYQWHRYEPISRSKTLTTYGLRPEAIAIDSESNLYTANVGSGNVTKITPGGQSTVVAQLSPCCLYRSLQWPSIAVDANDNIYVTRNTWSGEKNVLRLTASGESSEYSLANGHTIASTSDQSGNVYFLANNNVIRTTPGGVTTTLGSAGDGAFEIAVDPNGNIYTANHTSTVDGTTRTIRKLTPEGQSSKVVDLWTVGGRGGPTDLVCDPDGNLYVIGDGVGFISKITPSGRLIERWTSLPPRGDPTSITGDASGNIYTTVKATQLGGSPVSDPNRLIKTLPNGASAVIARIGDQPSDSVVDQSGTVYSANSGSNDVTRVTQSTSTSSDPLPLSASFRSIARDASGNLYGVDGYEATVRKVTPDGRMTILGRTGLEPIAIALDQSGNVFTANFGSDDVTKITPEGISTRVGSTGDGPFDLALDAAGNIYTSNYYSNNVSQLSPNGGSRVLGDTGTNPAGIVLDGVGNVFTANAGSNNVTKLTPEGISSVLGTTGTRPAGITIDSFGNLYTTNYDSNNVSRIEPDGSSVVIAEGLGHPYSIAVDPTGVVYVASRGSWDPYIPGGITKIPLMGEPALLGAPLDYGPTDIVLDPSGTVYTATRGAITVTSATGIQQTLGPMGVPTLAIAEDDAGNIYTTSAYNTVTKTTPAGVSSTLGFTGNGPSAITVDLAGNVYTTNALSNNVTKITLEGQSLTLGSTGDIPVDISVDPAGNVYTANIRSDNVTKITPRGLSTTLGPTGHGPSAIALDSNGNIYTANSWDAGSDFRASVTKISPEGRAAIFARTGEGPTDIAIDKDDNIYVANELSMDVTKITPTGVSTDMGETGLRPMRIAVDDQGHVFTANEDDNTITEVSPGGGSRIVGVGAVSPEGLLLGRNCGIYVADYSFGVRKGSLCSKVDGAVGPTYRIQSEDVGARVELEVIGTNPAGQQGERSIPTRVITQAPTVTSAPAILGTPQVGQNLTASPGSWEAYPEATQSYRWERCDQAGSNCSTIPGATSSTYLPVRADRANKLKVVVTATNSVSSVTETSGASEVVTQAPTATSAPAISGTPQVGQNLTASPGSWEAYPDPTQSYRWERCDQAGSNCSTIPDATSATYRPVRADRANKLKVVVTATNSVSSVTETSGASEVVTQAPTATSAPAISGTPQVGQNLTASPGSWEAYPDPTQSYRWERCEPNETNLEHTVWSRASTVQIPTALATDDSGNLFTANAATQTVSKLSPDGNSYVFGTTGLSPRDITVDSVGNVYTANKGSNNVTKITPAGVASTLGSTGSDPLGITVDSSGNVYTANNGSNNVTKITPAGVSSTLGSTGSNPWGITVDSSGNVYTANNGSNNVTKITPAGVSSTLGSTGLNPRAIALDSEGNVYTANFSSHNVSKVAPNGETSTLGPAWNPTGLAIDSGGNIYSGSPNHPAVTKITPAGTSSWHGQVGENISGLVLDSSNNLYTVDGVSNTVTKITSGGQSVPFGDLDSPQALASNSLGDTFIVNRGSDSVTRLGRLGGVTFSPAGSRPTAIVGDSEGKVYTADSGSNTVTKIDSNGFAQTVGTTGAKPVAIALGSAGEIYTANYEGNSVTRIGRDGVAATFGSTGEGPSGITVDTSGNVFTANVGSDTVTRISPAGVSSTQVSVTGSLAGVITSDSRDNIYVVETGERLRVLKIGPSGDVTALEGPGSDPGGIAVDSEGSIYISNRGSDSITKVRADGTATILGSSGRSPRGLSADEDGNVLVVNSASGTVTQIKPCGTVKISSDRDYTAQASDYGKRLRVTVTASNTVGSSREKSTQTSPVGGLGVSNNSPPSISGTARVFQTLTASPGSWSGVPEPTFGYRWVRCDETGANCSNIAGATGTFYTPDRADRGKRIKFEATATNPVSSAAEMSSLSEVITQAPINTSSPWIPGIPVIGQTLSASPGSWDGYPEPTSPTYQWIRCNEAGYPCGDILGANSAEYLPTAADRGKRLQVRVTVRNSAGEASQTSASSRTVYQSPTNTLSPMISGTARVGASLSTTQGTWDGYPSQSGMNFRYRWLRCDQAGSACTNIPYVTWTSYRPESTDAGRRIRVEVTAINDGGEATVISEPSDLVTEAPSISSPPQIQGSNGVGQTLRVESVRWRGYPEPSPSYQWFRCDQAGSNCSGISGATSTSYSPSSLDVARKLRVQVTISSSEGEDTETSEPSQQITQSPVNTSAPSISGISRVGQTLSASPGSWSGYPEPNGIYGYQWLRCDREGSNCSDITGATSGAYIPSSADGVRRLRVKVTAFSSAGYGFETSAPTEVIPQAPTNSSVPTISGVARVGETLTSSPGAWTGHPEPVPVFQWIQCNQSGISCSNVSGATSSTYVPTSADAGKTLKVRVTATNSEGQAVHTSDMTQAVTQAPSVIYAPRVEGYPRVGEWLQAWEGRWSGFPAPSLEYQWLRCDLWGSNCTEIPSFPRYLYRLTSADAGKKVKVRVTATNSVGQAVQTSELSAVINQIPTNDSSPTISGSARVGETLSASPGSWTGYPEPVATYRWLRCDGSGSNCSEILGATSAAYVLVLADASRRLRVLVTAANTEGSVELSSEPTGIVAENPDSSPAPSPPEVVPAPPSDEGSPAWGEFSVKGPSRTKRGDRALFRVKVENSGDAAALGIRLSVKGGKLQASQLLEPIAPGISRVAEFSLRFRTVGRVSLEFTVTSANADPKSTKRSIRVTK